MPVLVIPAVVRSLAAAACGATAWWIWSRVEASAPGLLRFIVAATIFVAGPGLAALLPLRRHLDSLERWTLPWVAGLVASPLVAELLGRAGGFPAFPFVAASLGAIGLDRMSGRATVRAPSRAFAACGTLLAVALAAGWIAYAHRVEVKPQSVAFYGDYDTYDSTYYADMSAELAYRVPPQSPFRAGHPLNYAYYPELLLAAIHRFGDVSLVDEYFRWGWPSLLGILALASFTTVRRLADSRVSFLATILLLFGSDFSYIATLVPHRRPYWDNLLWSTNWMTPSAEMLYFNPWTPALAVLFLAIWALRRHEEAGGERLLVVASVCVAALMQFKPFAFAVVSAGLAASAVTSGADVAARRRFTTVLLGGVALAAPFIVNDVRLYADSQSRFTIGNGYLSVLPSVVSTQLNLEPALRALVRAFDGSGALVATARAAVAILLFFTGGLGVRALALPLVWWTLRHPAAGGPLWRLLAWMVVAGALVPLVIVTSPYHQTFMFFQAGLFVLWIFVARMVVPRGPHAGWRRPVASALVVALAIPSTVHYLHEKWTDRRHLFATIDAEALVIVNALRATDRDRTVVLHRYPSGPSFFSMLSERRVVLAWAPYERESQPLERSVNDFFRSADGARPEQAWRTVVDNHVTHVVVNEADNVHPEVLCRLQPVIATHHYRLYAVPDQAQHCSLSGVE